TFEEDFRQCSRARSSESPQLYAVSIGTVPSLVFWQPPLDFQSQQATLYVDLPDPLQPPDLTPTPAAQDDTSGTDPALNPFHSLQSPESNPVQTNSHTNRPEVTAPQDHTSHGSASSPSPFSPAENRDTPAATQDDPNGTNPLNRLHSRPSPEIHSSQNAPDLREDFRSFVPDQSFQGHLDETAGVMDGAHVRIGTPDVKGKRKLDAIPSGSSQLQEKKRRVEKQRREGESGREMEMNQTSLRRSPGKSKAGSSSGSAGAPPAPAIAQDHTSSTSSSEERHGGGEVEVEGTGVHDDSIPRVQKFFKDEQKCRRVIQMKGDEAQRWLDLLQALMDNSSYPRPARSNIFKVMLHLSKNSGMYPECLTIKNVEKLGEHPVAGGGFGDVWKGRIAEQNVCLKIVRVFNASDLQQLVKEYMQEAIVWQQLQHPNLLPFVGMYYLSESQGQLCLVSPWMDRGNLVTYLKDTPKEQVNHHSLASDIASGLAYLHDRKIVHGDMKGANVLITPELRACIADFGLSHVADSHALKLTTSVTSRSRGTMRWLAPELLIPKPSSVSTRQSDMYAYGCVCYEIFAGCVPFYDLIDSAVLLAVYIEKQQPSRPIGLDDDAVWELMTSCWNYDPSDRPTAADLLNRVHLLHSSRIPGGEGSVIEFAPSWESRNVDKIRSNVDYPSVDLDLLDSI
ncbi:hypothetical protein PQX77_014318, partial [Marasmius sp. AFHP31]